MFQLTQKLDEMVTFTRFEDYISKAFESTDQMKNIDVLKTDLDEGTVQITSDVSYLGEKFFQ